MTPDQIREAVRTVNIDPLTGNLNAVRRAALAYADLLENSEKVDWCEPHNAQSDTEGIICWRWAWDDDLPNASQCRIERRLLVKGET